MQLVSLLNKFRTILDQKSLSEQSQFNKIVNEIIEYRFTILETQRLEKIEAIRLVYNGISGRLLPTGQLVDETDVDSYINKIIYFDLDIVFGTSNGHGVNIYPIIKPNENQPNLPESSYILERCINADIDEDPTNGEFGKTFLYDYGTAGNFKGSDIHPSENRTYYSDPKPLI